MSAGALHYLHLINRVAEDTIEEDKTIYSYQWSKAFRGAIRKASGELLSRLSASKSIQRMAKWQKEKQTLPSDLRAAPAFQDTNSFIPNRTIDAGENSSITVAIKNQGKGTAFDVRLSTELQDQNIHFPASLSVGDIEPGGTKEVSIPLAADLSLSSGTADFRIIAKENRGYDSKTYRLNIPTAAIERPQLSIVRYKLNDGNTGLASGNGNGIPENGETIELIPFVRNTGIGRAVHVKLAVQSLNQGIELIRGDTVITEILPGQTETGKLAFSLPRTYPGGNLKIGMVASDVRGVSDADKIALLTTQSNRPILAYTYRILDHNGNQVNVLKNGVRGVIEITPSNNGRMEARDVSIKLSSSELSITKARDDIPGIAAESKYAPIRFPFRAPRTLENASADVRLSISQIGFSGFTDNIHIPIKLELPKFEITHQILDPNNNGMIEQGESIDLLVRIKNTGGLDARNATLEVALEKDGVVYSGPKTFDLGRIAAGQTSDKQILTLNVTRRALPGTLPVHFTVSQEAFPSKELPLSLNIATEKPEIITVARQKNPSSATPMARTIGNSPPLVMIAMPTDQKRVAGTFETVSGVVRDDKGIDSIEVYLNGRMIDAGRAIKVIKSETDREKQNFRYTIPLKIGKNDIRVTAFDIENLSSSDSLTLYREARKGDIYAAVIGINDYRHIPHLKYANNDARAFADYMRGHMGLDGEHLFELYDREATIFNIKSLLGTTLRNKACHPEDTVYIFFAGHGAPESDPAGPNEDGIAKYILAHDSNVDDLYTSALPMDEIARIFSRIRAERVVLFADTCYSGGSGGRTVLAAGMRTSITDKFLERIAGVGKGRIILTSSSAREVSQESDELKHGYFTYYLLEGLRGPADISLDGEVDVDEIYRYLNKHVVAATNGSQHPVKKGEAEGRVIVGRVKD